MNNDLNNLSNQLKLAKSKLNDWANYDLEQITKQKEKDEQRYFDSVNREKRMIGVLEEICINTSIILKEQTKNKDFKLWCNRFIKMNKK